MGLPLEPRVESIVHRVKTFYPVKKEFLAQLSVKKVMLTDSWDMRGLITIDFVVYIYIFSITTTQQ